ncbi:MAG TPA: hypothetical protein VFZ58_01350 [Candidatus Saccharimonadales bacterium]
MLTVGVLAIAFALLFLLAFATKRRFGVLGLGLTAGALLSEYWTGGASSLLQQQGVELTVPPLESVVAIALTLLPVLILFSSGPSYHQKPQQLVGSLLFAAMAFLILFPILESIFVIEPNMQSAISAINTYGTSLLALLIVLAIADTALAKTKRHSKKEH